MAAQMVDRLAERMVLTKIVLADSKMDVKKAAREDGLMTVIRCQ